MKDKITFYRVTTESQEIDFIYPERAIVMALCDGGTITARNKDFAHELAGFLVWIVGANQVSPIKWEIKQNTYAAVKFAEKHGML